MANTPLSHSHHVVPARYYHINLLVLALLMGLTIAAAYWSAPGGVVVNNIIAVGIASIKAYLVILIFMGVKWASPLTKVWVLAGFFGFSLMFIVLCDYMTRQFEPANGWVKNGQSAYPPVRPGSVQNVPDNVNFRPRGSGN
jgi:caa(3)-type oxidase subunit IV